MSGPAEELVRSFRIAGPSPRDCRPDARGRRRHPVVGRASAPICRGSDIVDVSTARFCARTRRATSRDPSSAAPAGRVREWTGSVGAVVERAAGSPAASSGAGASIGRRRARGGRARDFVRLGMSAAAPAGVATEKRPAAPEAAAAPEEEQTNRSGAASRRLVAYDDEGHRPKAWRRDLSPKKPATRRASKGARVAFADGSKPVSVDTPAPVADPQRQAQQRRLLGRRMDRAIWDAFRSREFAPIEALLAHGADAGYVRTEGGGETALMAAAYHGRGEWPGALQRARTRASRTSGHDAAALARVKGNATLATLLDGRRASEADDAPPRAAARHTTDGGAMATASRKQRGDGVPRGFSRKVGMDDDASGRGRGGSRNLAEHGVAEDAESGRVCVIDFTGAHAAPADSKCDGRQQIASRRRLAMA